MILNCVSVDDEPPALGLINTFIEKTPFLHLSQSYSTSSHVIPRLTQPDFHILFLDIHMPGVNGIEIARALKEADQAVRPRIIFTTAHTQVAVESYQVEALGYLLKPFEYEDFLTTANKAKRYFEALPDFHAPELLREEALFVRSDYQLIKISFEDIRYIQGLKDYVTIHLKSSEKPVITLTTLKSLADKLPQNRFRRVQKSYIVALDAVTSLSANSLWIGSLEINIGEQYKEPLHTVFSKLLK